MERSKSLIEVRESILYEVHCTMCGAKLGYYLEQGDTLSDELARLEAICLECTKRIKK